MMKKPIFVLGIILLVYGASLCLAYNFNLGVVLTLILGITFILWEFLSNKIKYFKLIITILLCAEGLLLGFIAIYGQFDNVTYSEDALIVLGAGIKGEEVTLPLRYRLDKAVEYYEKNPNAVIVVTGGKGFRESITEARAMEKYLLKCGVKGDRIIKEEKATSTNENMRFSKEILDTYFEGEYNVGVITNNFHIYRSVQIAKSESFEKVTHMNADMWWYDLLPCYLRESLAVLKMWVMG